MIPFLNKQSRTFLIRLVMTREEALKIVQSATVWTDEERDALAMLIPELNESEDERIRKQFIDAIKIGRSNSGIPFTEEAASRYIAWLEKHSEEEIQKIRKEEYTNGFNDAAGFGKQKEQKPWKVGANAYFTPEQKPAEYLDRDKVYAIMKKLHNLSFSQNILINSTLKSLRPQSHWKPSEEQMKALEDAFRKNGSDEYRRAINSLYQDLKKL